MRYLFISCILKKMEHKADKLMSVYVAISTNHASDEKSSFLPSFLHQVFGLYFSPREKTDFILTALDGLTEHSSSTNCATTEGLLASIARNCGAEIEKVRELGVERLQATDWSLSRDQF